MYILLYIEIFTKGTKTSSSMPSEIFQSLRVKASAAPYIWVTSEFISESGPHKTNLHLRGFTPHGNSVSCETQGQMPLSPFYGVGNIGLKRLCDLFND